MGNMPRGLDFGRITEEVLKQLGQYVLEDLASDGPRDPRAQGKKQPSLAPDPASPWTVLGLLPDQPLVVAEAVYRARAKREHPDVGGDPTAFRRLTEAIEVIRTTNTRTRRRR